MADAPHVVIIGAGFGGLYAAGTLAKKHVRITVIDRKNHHTFQPLLYQVATAKLSPADIASPIRSVLGRYKNVHVLLDEAIRFDLANKKVQLKTGEELAYDYAILATGATHAYFGHEEWATLAPGLKSLEDAVEIRRRVLLAFEMAEREALIDGKRPMLNFVIVGGGPTGVELAGSIAEIAQKVMAKDFRGIDPTRARVVLLEAGQRILPAYPEDLSRSAERQLRNLGVDVLVGRAVTGVQPGKVLVGEEVMASNVTLWAAGVKASPLGNILGAPTDRAGRVKVLQDLTLPEHPEVFVIGDLADIKDKKGKPVPGVAPAAIQQGKAAARNVWRSVQGKPREDFYYFDKGSLATIGRGAGIAELGRIHLSGLIAWIAWLTVHIFFLIGFRNRVLVFIQWAWAYFTFESGARLITGRTDLPEAGK
ncbi:MAG: NAD(P)/FAD-dependent oxidoreductase [Terriglobales bacterium]|jgi:NADH dehydrogenase